MMTMEAPLVSIIMAARDTAPYLPACLDSILDQTYPHWELIAVNDHSVDTTKSILNAYAQKDDRIRVFDSPGQKLIPALQEGYRRCTGMLINRMDSDDRMPNDKLEILVHHWLKYGKGTVIAGGTEHFVDEGEVGDGFRKYESWLNQLAREQRHHEEIYKECVIPSHSWLMHRDDFSAVGAFDPLVYPEDYDLCFRIYRKGLKIVGIDHILHFWRDRSNRISRTWECYKDNRYFDLKVSYFYELDRIPKRPLVLWGAGRNGKDLAKLLMQREGDLIWICENDRKIGKDIYDTRLHGPSMLEALEHPQILIAVSSPNDQVLIRKQLEDLGKQPIKDFWFFT